MIEQRRMVAGLVVVALVVVGCVPRLTIIPKADQSAEQLARDQRECEAEAQKASGYVKMAGKAFVGSLVGPLVGGAIGGAAGLVIGLSLLASSATDRPLQFLAVIAAGGIAAGAVVGAFMGPKEGVKQEQEAVTHAFEQCMRDRGYIVGRDRPER